jgi:hypothetical protein
VLFSGVCHGTPVTARDAAAKSNKNLMTENSRHGIAGEAGERNREDVAGKHRSGHAPVFARHVLSIQPARRAVPCLMRVFYLRDLRFSLPSSV